MQGHLKMGETEILKLERSLFNYDQDCSLGIRKKQQGAGRKPCNRLDTVVCRYLTTMYRKVMLGPRPILNNLLYYQTETEPT
jgi:hypothetical protein